MDFDIPYVAPTMLETALAKAPPSKFDPADYCVKQFKYEHEKPLTGVPSINFTIASLEWKSNKKRVRRATYSYVCGAIKQDLSSCQNVPYVWNNNYRRKLHKHFGFYNRKDSKKKSVRKSRNGRAIVDGKIHYGHPDEVKNSRWTKYYGQSKCIHHISLEEKQELWASLGCDVE